MDAEQHSDVHRTSTAIRSCRHLAATNRSPCCPEKWRSPGRGQRTSAGACWHFPRRKVTSAARFARATRGHAVEASDVTEMGRLRSPRQPARTKLCAWSSGHAPGDTAQAATSPQAMPGLGGCDISPSLPSGGKVHLHLNGLSMVSHTGTSLVPARYSRCGPSVGRRTG